MLRYRSLLLLALLLVCYAYVLPRWSDWSQNSRLDLVLALADDRSVSIDRYVVNTGDYALFKGHAYSDKAPGPAFLALPAYLALRPLIDSPWVQRHAQSLGGASLASTLRADGSGLRDDKVRFALVQYLLTLLTVVVPAALLGLLLYHAALRLGVAPAPALLSTLVYALGSPAAAYAGNFYSHQIVAVLLFGAFFLAGDAQRVHAGWRQGVLCGLLLGWAVISEYPVALAAAIIGVYALVRRGGRWSLWLMVGGAVPLALLAVYDRAAFGTPLPVGYNYSALWQNQHHTGFLSITFPSLEALWGLSFGAFRGLFVRSPWLLLALPGYALWWRARQSRAELWVTLLVPLSLYLFYSSSIMWWGGFAVGPRYLVPMLPFLALPAAVCCQHVWRVAWTRTVVIGAGALSCGLVWTEALASQLFPNDAIRQTWSGYVVPAWERGDIARNLGMAFGLRGALSLAPLAMVAVGLVLLMAFVSPAADTAT